MCKTETDYKAIQDPEAIWYGPHACNRCGNPIIKQAAEQGGCELDAPFEIRYPNHVYTEHDCPQNAPSLRLSIPSRFQYNDSVSIDVGPFRICGLYKILEITFTENKIFYTVITPMGHIRKLPSHDVHPDF